MKFIFLIAGHLKKITRIAQLVSKLQSSAKENFSRVLNLVER